ncbi:MAG: CDP-archaeol synthase [Eubacteriales bacterium]|nr:CDP-archaeol synthase [Eubacteriales bacterium]
MKIRVISSVIGLVLFMAAMLIHDIAAVILIFALSLIAMLELFSAFKKADYKPLHPVGVLSCVILLWGLISDSYLEPVLLTLAFSFMVTSACVVIFHKRVSFKDAAITVYGVIYIVLQFSFIAQLRISENGAHLVWLVFAGAWGSDTGAYFIGKLFGKRKLIPEISQNKTIAGAFGGIIGGVVFVLLIALIIKGYVPFITFADYLIIGLISGIAAQFGDLNASIIKRHSGIKDFGSIIPGHGGILDRFDSTLFVAPLVYSYLILFSGV